MTEKELQVSTDNGQRCAKFMRSVGSKAGHLFERSLQSFKHLVECFGEVFNLVSGSRFNQSLFEVRRGDLSRSGSDVPKGEQRALREKEPPNDGDHQHKRQNNHPCFPQPLQAFLYRQKRSRHLDLIRLAIAQPVWSNEDQPVVEAIYLGLRPVQAGKKAQSWRGKTPVARVTGLIDGCSTGAHNPEEQVIGFRRVVLLDLILDIVST